VRTWRLSSPPLTNAAIEGSSGLPRKRLMAEAGIPRSPFHRTPTSRMQFFVGTSGYSYKEWKGTFYPKKLPQKEMLRFYAGRFSTVEVNNTFYRMPSPKLLESWAEQVPNDFRFVLKAPQAITHFKRLQDVEEPTGQFLGTASVLKERQGPLLFQLPPNFKKDVPRLERFLNLIKDGTSTAFEFRHESWFEEDVFSLLRAKACALCVADADDLPSVDHINTARFGILRLRRARYSKRQLAEWIDKLNSQNWDEVYVFFKHEDTGTGAKLATRFIELVNS
jgi:uncharacterized protein YecE (DUF72 family)